MNQPVLPVDSAPRYGPPLRSIDAIDGPRGLPLLGNALQIDPPRMHLVLEEWQRQYGALFRLRLGRHSTLVLSDAPAISTLLHERPHTWRRWSVIERMASEAGLEGVFSVEGDTWRRQRRLVMQAFDTAHLKSYFPSLVRVTERLRARWTRAVAAGASIDLQVDLMRYTVDVTAGLAFGSDIDTLQAGHDVLQDDLDKVFPMMQKRMNALVPYWRYVRLPSDRRFERHLARIHKEIRRFVDDARRGIERDLARGSAPQNLLEAMIVAHDADTGALTDREIAGNVFTILLAGEDTTANSLAWACWLLFRHPDAWQRTVGEIEDVLGDDDLPRSFEQLGRLGYTAACLSEAMRLRPVAPVIGLEALHDTSVLDVHAPTGTVVLCLMRPPAMDERNFTHAAQFRPERWLDGEIPADTRTAKRASMPFGAGPRMCPGRYLALCEMKMVLAMLARNFTLTSIAGPDGAEPQERMSFTMMPAGLHMRIAQRERPAPVGA